MFAFANKDHLPDDFAAAANIWPVSLSYSAIIKSNEMGS
jgi:hypothetical protein